MPCHRTFTRKRLLSGERFVPLHIGVPDPLKRAEVPQDVQDRSMMVFFTRATYVLGNIEKRIAKHLSVAGPPVVSQAQNKDAPIPHRTYVTIRTEVNMI